MASTDGVAFAYLGRDESEGRPVRHCPRDTDERDQDGGAGGGGDEESGPSQQGEEGVGKEPGAAEGEPADFQA